MLSAYYEDLARKGDITTLVKIGRFDERIYEVLVRHELVPQLMNELSDPTVARFVARGMMYQPISDNFIGEKLINSCSALLSHRSAAEGASLAELIGNCALQEKYRTRLFNLSETHRHMLLVHNPFAHRATLRLLAYLFSYDDVSDAVASLQQKTDILNHVNRIYVKTFDWVSERFSVRVMSLAGGYNESRLEVDKTERMVHFVTRGVPEFFSYFLVGFSYARIRHYPQRVQGIVPKWLARHRALFSGFWCACLGFYVNCYSDWKQYRHRIKYEFRHAQEMRRRRGAAIRGVPFENNKYFDSLVGVTRHVFSMQCSTYMVVGGALAFTCMPLPRINFPKFMGDVPFRYPYIPRFFPMILGMHCASRCAVPFVFAPFCAMTAFFKCGNASLYDRYVHWRYNAFLMKNQVDTYEEY